ncbi:Copper-fist domain-containing protein [Fusarium keratoplasticum]|uniref:Copper-fist domain-containing protein n=1 Tax=Fusarium keratoplasticum TaxID=1328300 RepID=A0ACC0R9R5_9HYPO|nr:Copper-fist domain-containing protein [Fusarium keratoplasticum]KAI8675701.1 Copper-fist domain-containing protein [Fusarium keratoplasticum]KAI8682151.1 Copper-fist domain-containing protein [Fusarium keratoplasticum]
MITNGEKYACESCIRGHRVAQCQHTDRPLQRVGKKGRPVSQCNHCRTLRTSRSVHTNCKCGSTSRQATLKQFGQERCLCCEGGDCTCAYKTGQKKHCGSSTSSPSAISNQRSPGIALSPTLSDSTASMAIPHDIPDSDGTYPALTHVDLSNQPSETVPDTWPTPPDNGPHLVIPETPDWLGALDSVLGPVPDEQTQFSMSALNDPLLPMDSSYLADFLSDLPQTEQPNNADPIPTFDPALLDLTLFNFDNHEQSPRQS